MRTMIKKDRKRLSKTKNSATSAQEKIDIQDLMERLAHKIKNPIHSMGINLEVIKTKINRSLGENATNIQKHLDIVTSELSYMKRIIQGFSDYTTPLEGKSTKIRVENLLQDVHQLLKIKMPETGFKIDFDLSKNLPSISVNKAQITQALFHVIANGIEASSEERKLVVRARQNNNCLEIQIRDRGAGISPQELTKVFDLFYTTKKGRIGLGLPMAKKLIETNDGEIKLRSQAGGGTTVTVYFHSA